MVTVAGTVEGAGFNTGSLGLFGKTRANELGSGDVATAAGDVRELSTHFGFDRGGRDQRTAVVGRDDAGVNVQVGAMNRQAIDLLNINYIDTDEFKLSKNITLFTNFKSLNNFETPTRYYFRKIYDNYILDSMEDELVLGIDTSKGLLIVCGCSHIGIANIVENIKCRTQKKIYGIIGGLHLSKASDERIEKVLKYFDECNIEFFGVSHCTGEKVTKILRESKKNFIYNNTGNTIIIN